MDLFLDQIIFHVANISDDVDNLIDIRLHGGTDEMEDVEPLHSSDTPLHLNDNKIVRIFIISAGIFIISAVCIFLIRSISNPILYFSL